MTYPHKPVETSYPLLEVMKERWSPRLFAEQPVEEEKLKTVFEAARWAPSSYNEQPWRFIYATKDDGEAREKLESLLVEGNAWAKKAPVLIINFYKKTFAHNGKENRVALHDLGAANISIAYQATALGLITHQMSGFDAAKANALLGVPEDYFPGSMMTIGYAVQENEIPDAQKESELSPRKRNPQDTFVFHGTWKA